MPAETQPPACRHFGHCGGCSLQHLPEHAYVAHKLRHLDGALSRHGLVAAEVAPLARVAPGSRRRARLAAIGRRQGAMVGFAVRESRTIVDVAQCPVLMPRLEGLVPLLRDLFARMLPPGARADAELLEIDGALDIGLVGGLPPDLAATEQIIAFAAAAGAARVTWRAGDRDAATPLLLRQPVRTRFGGIAVDIPPGAFLQPTEAGEAALRRFVVDAAEGDVLELFAGCGTFSLPLVAAGHRVHAVEGASEPASALAAAGRSESARGRLSTERRDLVRRPLSGAELAPFRTVLLDPPRAGAREQASALARSRVQRVVYLSCSPASFARDAAALAQAGFRLERLLPLDQFLWSRHMELAALLLR